MDCVRPLGHCCSRARVSLPERLNWWSWLPMSDAFSRKAFSPVMRSPFRTTRSGLAPSKTSFITFSVFLSWVGPKDQASKLMSCMSSKIEILNSPLLLKRRGPAALSFWRTEAKQLQASRYLKLIPWGNLRGLRGTR
ncbi:hypothetical protein Cob_v009544 [Colletotrichum orbiculare MAFF 240422]|uniref:Uncharacterized protein n=1 Tax=Colletotrichum orbiculare (strain 104-T / ATCC 96160 / CBS 514.97 / LARS 414 / MAFF 240422) TaxID=1213857 RepID=A0A484FGB3_COLOR|nr:hypothetical protein Cob_v009544 [Colletotrichum orbiculare MAFF 240422]